MKVELIEFYEEINDKENRILKGSAHIYIEDLDMDLRGVECTFEKNTHWITLPVLYKFDKELKKRVRFPVIQFANRDKTLELRKSVIKAVIDHVYTTILKKKVVKGKKKFVKKVKNNPVSDKTRGGNLLKKIEQDTNTQFGSGQTLI